MDQQVDAGVVIEGLKADLAEAMTEKHMYRAQAQALQQQVQALEQRVGALESCDEKPQRHVTVVNDGAETARKE